MIQSFKGRGTADIFDGLNSKAGRDTCPRDLRRISRRKLDQLDSVETLEELAVPPGNRLELLTGARDGSPSLRITAQYRICFVWTAAGPSEVEVVDYH